MALVWFWHVWPRGHRVESYLCHISFFYFSFWIFLLQKHFNNKLKQLFWRGLYWKAFNKLVQPINPNSGQNKLEKVYLKRKKLIISWELIPRIKISWNKWNELRISCNKKKSTKEKLKNQNKQSWTPLRTNRPRGLVCSPLKLIT